MVLVLHDQVDDLRQRSRQLDACRASADDDEAQHAAALRLVLLDLVGALEHMEDMVADVQRFLQRLHREGILLDALHAEEIRRRARRQDEIIVGHLAVVRDDDLALLVQAAQSCHEEIDVLVVAEEGADGVGDLVRRKERSRKLVKQRLEKVKIAAIDDHDVEALVLDQIADDLDSAEACADNHDARFLAHVLSSFLGAEDAPTCARSGAPASAAGVIHFAAEKLIDI